METKEGLLAELLNIIGVDINVSKRNWFTLWYFDDNLPLQNKILALREKIAVVFEGQKAPIESGDRPYLGIILFILNKNGVKFKRELENVCGKTSVRYIIQ